MSAIDSLTHAHVAKFWNLPIYWVLENSPLNRLTDNPEDKMEFINKYHLSIGGGSGEHPALIIKNDAVILNLIRSFADLSQVKEASFDKELIEFGEEILETYADDMFEEVNYWGIDKNQWPIDTFVAVANKFEKNNIPTEEKIQHAIALFIIHEMPVEHCLEDQDLIKIAKMIKSNQWEKAIGQDELNCFKAISGLLDCHKMGKIIKDGKVVWGYSLNDWKNDNLKINT